MRAPDSDGTNSDDDEAASITSSSAESPSRFRPRGSLTAPSAVSNSSSRSIATTFSTLAGDDVAFFDQVVASLSPGDDSFASLKAVYQEIRGTWPGINDVRDAHLWNCLLSLVKVRGRDWSERWDAVRVKIGSDLREADLTASSIVTEAQVENDSLSHAHSREVGADWTYRNSPSHPMQEEWLQDVSQSEGSNADCSSESDNEDDFWDQRRQSSATSSLTTVGAEAGQSTPPPDPAVSAVPLRSNAHKGDILALQARMATLTRQAGELALQAVGQSAPQTPRAREKARAPDEEEGRPARLRQLLQSDLRLRQGNDLPSAQGRSQASREESVAGQSFSVSPVVLPFRSQQMSQLSSHSPARDVLSAVRSSRGSLREAAYRKAEESEEVAWEGSARFAQKHYEDHLLAACFGWWRELYDRQAMQEHKAKQFNTQALLSRMLHLWKSCALTDRDVEYMALRADAVRCQLSAWRKWRRLAKTTRTQRWEGRKISMRESYTVVKQKRQRRAEQGMWQRWRARLLERRSATFRYGHLLGGAFFLWRLKFDVAQTLGGQEQRIFAARKLALEKTAFEKWRIWTRLMGLLDEWKDKHTEQQLRQLLLMWKMRASLTTMERAYSTHRLHRNVLQTWLQRLSEMGLTKRRQLQADRRLNKSTQSKALGRWILAIQHAKRRDYRAINFRQGSDRKKLSHALATWRQEERASLFQSVHDGRMRKACFAQWQGVYKRKVVALSGIAQTFAAASDRNIISRSLSHWRTAILNRREVNARATAMKARDVQKGALRKWISAERHHLRRTEQAVATEEWSLLKRTFIRMRAKVRSTKLQAFSDRQAVLLLKRASSLWRARATQQSVDRLGVARLQSMTNLRIERQTLQHWTQRVIERRSLLIEVAEAHDMRIALQALQQWLRTKRRVEDLQQLGQSFRDVRIEEAMRRNLIRWSFRFRRARSLQERAARFVASKKDSIRSHAFVMWYDNWREQTLRGLEYEVALQRQADAKSRVLDVWLYRTTSFPAIRFDHSRLKRCALRKWREELPGAVFRRQAVQVDAHRLVHKAFYHWIESGKAQRAAKAAARFGGPSMTRLRRHSSRIQSPFLIKARRSGGNGHQCSSSPLVGGESGVGDSSRSLGAIQKARSEVLEIGRPSLTSRTFTPRPRSEANFASSGNTAAAQRFRKMPSISSEADLAKGRTGNDVAIVSLSSRPHQRLSSRKTIPQTDERIDRLASYRRSIAASSSACSERGADCKENTFTLTSHEARYEPASQRATAQGTGTGIGPRSLPALSILGSESEAERRGDQQAEARPESHASPSLEASASAYPVASTLPKQGGDVVPLRRTMLGTGHSPATVRELYPPRNEAEFLEDFRRKRRATMERQT